MNYNILSLNNKALKNKVEKSKLIVANYSLSFCNKEKFEDLWNKIKKNLEKDGYFVGNFSGLMILGIKLDHK